MRPSEGIRRRGDMLAVVLAMLRELRTGRVLVADLADLLGRKRRTVYRMLLAIERAGVPLERHREGPRVFYRVRREALERALGLR